MQDPYQLGTAGGLKRYPGSVSRSVALGWLAVALFLASGCKRGSTLLRLQACMNPYNVLVLFPGCS
ncbi:hypothetical protein HYDPIDRAFT_108872 [Hydnomerulius pinastri MD-312]|nr:hypothetical protein HYDPIDRAFT_108872 [Hydnomerulius pinastri MD-312]